LISCRGFVRCQRLIITAWLLAASALCRSARADGSSARADDPRPSAALAACASGDVAKGIGILGELYAETRSPSFVFNQGRCYQKNGQLEPARHRFAEYLRIGASEPPEDIRRAQAFVKEIDDTLARQRARLPPPVVGAPAGRPSAEHARTLRLASVVCAAIGVAAVGTGIYLSFKVSSTNDGINQEFANQDYVTDGARLQRQLADGARYETWQWIGYGVGVAALAGAVTTFVLGGSSRSWSGSSERAALDLTPAVSRDSVGGSVRLRF
jgi:hypothetical protein